MSIILLTRINRAEDAMEDAVMAGKNNPGSIAAVIAKAEAYYNMGNFERALG